MSATAVETGKRSTADRRYFLLRRVFSLTGLLPVGGFLLVHLYTNTFALFGRDRFNEHVGDIQSMPYVFAIEVAGILLPILLHTVLGFAIVFQARFNTTHYGYARNWTYTLQRVTAVLAFLFIGYHLYEYWWQKQLGFMPWDTFYDELGRHLAQPARLGVYVVGVTAVLFHFANGLWSFGVGWGFAISRAAQRRLAIGAGLLGALLWLVSMNVLLGFSTGRAPIDIHLWRGDDPAVNAP